MHYSGVSCAVRMKAGIMVLMMLIALLFSAFYITAEADHDCTGEDCLICACIRLCENTLRGIIGRASAMSAAAIPLLPVLYAAVWFSFAVFSDTLISRKVRLNN